MTKAKQDGKGRVRGMDRSKDRDWLYRWLRKQHKRVGVTPALRQAFAAYRKAVAAKDAA